jgi:inner membrane protein COX18
MFLLCMVVVIMLYIFLLQLQKQWNNLIIRDNCHPLKATILLWVQLPMWIFLSVAFRNFVYMLPHRDEGENSLLRFAVQFIS